MKNLLTTQDELSAGKTNLQEIVEQYIETIESKNDTVNAIVSLDKEKAREQARLIQKKIKDGSAGKLAGSVVAVKDLICEKGKKTTCSSNILQNFESVYNATVIEKLAAEDVLFLGRANMDEFAMGSSTENTIYGPSKNPHNSEYVTGGSSGGSAAAVAANMCSMSLGSDTGGSIRQPASYCGVVGLKPTYGRVSRYGLVAFASSFDCIGPFANNVTDAALLLEQLSGHDPMDQSSANQPVPNYNEALNSDDKLKIGVPEEYFGDGLESEVRTIVEDQLKALESDGHTLVPINLPHTDYAIATYYILATAEASSNLARYDGIRYGHRADFDKVEEELKKEQIALEQRLEVATGTEHEELLEKIAKADSPLIRLYKKSRTEGFGTEVKRRILLGTYVLSAGYYDAYFGKAQRVRRLIKQDFQQAYEQVDVIVSPTAPTTAFKLGENQDDPVQMYLNDIYTISANLAGICGISVPAGTHSNGLPVGIQFMADSFAEHNVLRAGGAIEKLHG